MQPLEYGGTDELDVIFTAPTNMTIVSSIYDPTARNLFIIFMNTTNGTLNLCQLVSLETLDSTVYQLPIMFNIANINNMSSFTSDVDNRRAFYTDQTGSMNLFSMSGLLTTTISSPLNSSYPIRSVAYTSFYNRLFIITDVTVDSCANLDTNNLQCCEALPRGTQFCALTFDEVDGDLYAYVLDRTTGIYQIVLNGTGCPTALRPVNKLGQYTNLQFAVDRGLYFASGSAINGQDNSDLYIANGTNNPRAVSIGIKIVALDISLPSTQPTSPTQETCFHGITYSLYRTAAVLAALFGTIMGIFMCVNGLFCIDFFMTKRIIRSLKQQIPHNLLEDRWNKLVEEKYAKLALESKHYSIEILFFLLRIYFYFQNNERKMILHHHHHLRDVNHLQVHEKIPRLLLLLLMTIIVQLVWVQQPIVLKYHFPVRQSPVISDVKARVI
jgi:hypothetical protein